MQIPVTDASECELFLTTSMTLYKKVPTRAAFVCQEDTRPIVVVNDCPSSDDEEVTTSLPLWSSTTMTATS